MSEETTKNLEGDESFETRVLAELGRVAAELARLRNEMGAGFAGLDGRITALDGRITALEEKVDSRLRETRPIWESVLSRLEIIDEKFDVHAHDMLELRAQMERVKKHIPPAA